MALKFLAVFLLTCYCGVRVDATASLTAAPGSPCTSSSTSIPTGTGNTITLYCLATTATVPLIAAGIANSGQSVAAASMIFKQGTSAKLTLTGRAGGDGTLITIDDTTLFPTAGDVSSAVDGTNNKMLVVTINNAPAAMATGGSWTCEVTAGGDADGSYDGSGDTTLDVAAEASDGTALDLSTYCTGTLNTVTLTVTPSTSDCLGTMACDIGEAWASGAVVQFLKDGNVWFQSSDGTTVKQSDGSTAYGSVTVATSGQVLTVTFVTATKLDPTYDGSWTCQRVSSTTPADNAASSAQTVTISTTTACTNPWVTTGGSCDKTVTCRLTTDVATVQTASGVIEYKKAATIVYKINPTDDELQNTGGTAIASTVATVVAPSTSDTKKAVLTLVTYDAAAVDGYWTCAVTGTSGTHDAESSPARFVYSACSSGAGQVAVNLSFILAALFAALMC